MKIVMTLLCRNEADIIADIIDFHISRGVDYVIATDNGSEDGTTEILEKYGKIGCLHLIREPELTHDQAAWVTRMAQLAAQKYEADWVINSDADEFWWPNSGSLKVSLAGVASEIDALAVKRTNFLPKTTETGSYAERMIVREVLSCNSLGNPLPPKVCHRGYPDVFVSDGNHKVSRNDLPVLSSDNHDIEILHFPIRTYSQFERKIRLGAEALQRNKRVVGTGIGSTWLHLYHHYYLTGRLSDYYFSQCATDNAVSSGISQGTLVVDRRLDDVLANLTKGSVWRSK